MTLYKAVNADRLREAARVLRERAEAAAPGPWSVVPGASNVWHFPNEGTPTLVVGGAGAARVQRRATEACLSDAAYIATMHPGVGLALADWLDKAAQEWDVWGEHDRNIDKPLVLADLILGAES